MIKTYKYNDKTKLTEHFKVSEFKCKCGKNHDIKIDTELPKLLEKLMERIGALHGYIYSGYRCTTHDKKVGGSGGGPHTQGYAVDIYFTDKNGKRISGNKVVVALEDMAHKCGVAIRCGGSSVASGNVHIDTKARKWYGDENYSFSKSISSLKGISDGKTGHKTFLSYCYKPTTKYVNASVLNVRSDKNTTSKIVKGLKFGSEVKVYYTENDWAKIGVSEWVSTKYLQDTIPVKMSASGQNEPKKEENAQKNENTVQNVENNAEKELDYEDLKDKNNPIFWFLDKIVELIKMLFGKK